MTRQLNLFDTPPEPAAPPALARRSDPATSHEAAEHAGGRSKVMQDRCLAVLGRQIRSLTRREIEIAAYKQFGGDQQTYGKRMHELVRSGEVVECEKRLCSVTGHNATTYRRATE